MLTYTKLWLLLEDRNMKKTDLKEVISSATLAKLGKNETVSSAVIEKICAFLKCQPGDIMEYISEESIQEAINKLNSMNKVIMDSFKEQGITQEMFATMMQEAMPEIIKTMYNGEFSKETFENNKIDINELE